MDTIESSINQAKIDYTFKILLVGDSGVGKSSILLRFTSDIFDDRPQTVGVDFKAKFMTLKDKGLKVTIWDTAGQEKFRTLTASYYRSAHGIILVYDVTNRETFINLSDVWLKEVDIYSTNQDCIKMLVGNKVDRVQDMVLLWDRKNEKPGKHKKFDSLWLGPYIIQDIVRPNSFHLSRLDGEPLDLPANGQMLKLFFKDNI